MRPELTLNLGWDSLPVLFPDFPRPDRWLQLLQRHAALVQDAAKRVRVTAVTADEAVRRQYAESLELLRIIEHARGVPAALADVGSGGGFPGLVIAAVRPGTAVHLVEPLQKRANLLREMALHLGLENVTVHPLRAEDAGRGPLRDMFPVVTARAVAELRELLEYTAPLASSGGIIALPKGSGFDVELGNAARACSELCCEFVEFVRMREAVSHTLGVALLRKAGDTPAPYPRRPGMPGKRPL